jgi:predicted acetyltransferase
LSDRNVGGRDAFSTLGAADHMVRRQGEVTGYIAYTQEDSDEPYRFSLACRDLVWTDAESLAALLRFVSEQAILGDRFIWTGPVAEPILNLLGLDVAQVIKCEHWMLRINDVRRALEERGYPSGIDTAVDLVVTDPALPHNEGSIRLEVSDGKGKIVPARNARARVDAGTLAALYSGWLPARDAVRVGRLQNASREDVDSLETIFRGPQPWMMDIF